jgi:hypothetical protein
MNEQDEYIVFRLPCAGLRYVAVLGRRSTEHGFQRIFNPFRMGRVHLADGSKEEIHHLPYGDFVHEIQRVEDGKLVYRYLASVKGNHNLHPISRRGAEVFASRMMTLRQVVEEYPEMPNLADYKDEEE